MLLGDVQAQPAQLGHRRPRGGQLLRVVLEQHPGLAPQVVLDAEVGDDVGQGLVVLGDGDRHGRSPEQSRGPSGLDRARVRCGRWRRTFEPARCARPCAASRSRPTASGSCAIRGDRDDVWSKGYLCPKGTTLGQLHHDPDRLRAPMIRDGDDVARGHAGTRPSPAARSCSTACVDRARHRRRHRLHRQPGRPQLLAQPLLGRAAPAWPASATIYSAGTVDQWPKNVSCAQMYGGHVEDPHPRRPPHRLLGGHGRQPAGVAAARCSPAPTCSARSTRIRERGGKVDRHRPPPHRHRRPGRRVAARSARAPTPRFLLARRATCSSTTGSSTSAPSPTGCSGVDEVRAAAAGFTPEAVADCCGIPADTHPRASPTSSPPPSARASTAASACATRSSARSPRWLVDVVNILTGHFDAEGGLMFGKPAIAPISSTADAEVTGEPSSAAGAPGCAAPPRCSARCRCRASPRRSPRRARARSRRSSPSPATRCFSAPDAGQPRRRAAAARVHDLHRQLPERDHAPRPRDPARASRRSSSPTATSSSGAGPSAPSPSGRRRSSTRGERPARVGDPAPPRLVLRRQHRRRRRRRRPRRRLVHRPVPHATASTRATAADCYDHGGPERMIDLRSAWARGATATARSPTASPSRRSRTPPARHRPRADGAPRSTRSCAPRSGDDRAGPAVHPRRPPPPAPAHGRAATRRLRARQPAPPPLEELAGCTT